MLLILLSLVVGVGLLAKAADQFVEGAARLAVMLRVSPIVIGAVIVGFGTSAPEMVVSGFAAVGGDGDLGIGNIIGSNLANLSLILGSAAIIIPLHIDPRILRKEAPLATGAALIFAGLVQGGISKTEGLIFIALMVAALAYLLIGSVGAHEPEAEQLSLTDAQDEAEETPRLGKESLRTIVGLVGTVAGAWMLVWGAVSLADRFGLNEGFVGVTLVAIGTSLPELVTAVAAARKGETDLIVGNLLGSNIFNSFAVGAVVGLLGDGVITDPSLTGTDLAFMLVVCVLAAVAMYTRRLFEKFEGALLLGIFIGFLISTWWTEARDGVEALLYWGPL